MIKLRVQELAEAQHMNKSMLQRRSGVTMPTLRAYWDNDVQSVHFASLERIADALGVDPLELLVVEKGPQKEEAHA